MNDRRRMIGIVVGKNRMRARQQGQKQKKKSHRFSA
jgi:hypothetical protein